ncbi:hypothetical protein B0H13DRAFT_2032485 [Mycena leptocephala]|nr:hypothetical protein B0H13DRAFT_2134193 [Mycena leptocephala]KAJ7822238.1 hypothetical protein B0H13DRAFT_2127271 [Mycena leptocephala]KAJ7897827.1 hypothetical protein B0H13DRAFT_2032485 [Mycena leptocephala]
MGGIENPGVYSEVTSASAATTTATEARTAITCQAIAGCTVGDGLEAIWGSGVDVITNRSEGGSHVCRLELSVVHVHRKELGGRDNRAVVFVVVKTETIATLHGTGSSTSRGSERGCTATTVDDEGEGGRGEVVLELFAGGSVKGGSWHVETDGVLTLRGTALTSRHPYLTYFRVCIFEQDTNDEGNVVGIGDAVVMLLDHFEHNAVADEFVE